LDVVGHDIGTRLAYTYAADWRKDAERLAVSDTAFPDITPPPLAGIPSDEVDVTTWHFAFYFKRPSGKVAPFRKPRFYWRFPLRVGSL
jgi:pimeloyl-ACP methyl ester carboxylesterase